MTLARLLPLGRAMLLLGLLLGHAGVRAHELPDDTHSIESLTDRATPTAAEMPAEVPWVTQQIEAPRVSFRTFRSQAAKADVSYHVYTPAAYDDSAPARFPVLYWLHGTEGGVNHIRPVARMFDRGIREEGVPPMIVVFVNGLSKRLWTDSKDGRAPVETVFIDELIPHIDESMRTIPAGPLDPEFEGPREEVLRQPGTIVRQAVGANDFTLALSRRFHDHLESLKIPSR